MCDNEYEKHLICSPLHAQSSSKFHLTTQPQLSFRKKEIICVSIYKMCLSNITRHENTCLTLNNAK